ncbi:ABC1 kinase family protein [Geosporobacter ferrireducens]|uniref:2-octaprenylphenol hydroxylase n=1 Tax=Geosporobacter ferrireducens TaxID=1424294 RepID=A0A1D8GER6_9FIRM|nr:AarF/UbiB family protein [Geosporobacter ferrireducens]AOT69385.1 2-octaprenylphenol hydroxylase [Geosporobacter ferrireducens]
MISRGFSIKRYKEIIMVFSKHGFGLLMDQLGIFKYLKLKREISDTDAKFNNIGLSAGERLRLSLEELGPAFIKLGQILSTRPDIFPSDVIEELKKLQDSVPPFSFSEVRAVIENEFEDELENIYKEFEEKPVAAASISQVHCGRLNTGKLVAVKVQRPGIEKIINLDLNILKDLAYFVDHHTQYGKLYDCSGMVFEFENIIKNELDFRKEAENAEIFKQNFSRDEGIKVPEVKWIYTTRSVLTMEYIEGIRVDDCSALDIAGIDRKMLARKIAASICNQILRDGFFHADPHPGNIQITSDGTLVFLDLGMVGHLNENRKRMITDFFIGVTSRDSRMVVKSIIDLDTMEKHSDIKKFEKDVDRIIEKYLTLPLDKMKIGDLFHETFNIAFSNHIKIPREFALIAKTLGSLQCLVERLDPDLNALVVAKPIAKKLIYQSFSTERFRHDMKKDIRNYRDLFKAFPITMLDFLRKMETDNLVLQHELKDIMNIQRCFNKGINRMAFSIVLLAVSIIIAGIIIGSGLSASSGEEMYLLSVGVLKIGLIIAVIIILGLIISVMRANRL